MFARKIFLIQPKLFLPLPPGLRAIRPSTFRRATAWYLVWHARYTLEAGNEAQKAAQAKPELAKVGSVTA